MDFASLGQVSLFDFSFTVRRVSKPNTVPAITWASVGGGATTTGGP